MKKKLVKKNLFRMGTMLMAFSMLGGTASLTAFAQNQENTITVTSDDKKVTTVYYLNNEGKRSGIKSITADGTLFYDCSNNTKAEVTTAFLMNMLKEKQPDQNASILSQWANVASAIFQNEGEYTCSHDNYADYYGKKHSNSSKEKCNVADLLADSNSNTNGSKKKDNYHSTGLSVSSSFKDLRYKMCEEISNRIGRYTLEPNNILSQGKNCDDALPEFNDDTKRDIIYNIVTSITQEGKSCKYQYNSYGLAFYDFDLKLIDNESVEYVQNTDKTVKDSSVSKKLLDTNENTSLADMNASLATQVSKSETISTSLTNSESYSYDEMFGGQFMIGFESFFRGAIESSLTYGQVYQSAKTNSTTTLTSESDTKTISYTVPAHTKMIAEQNIAKDSMTVSYDTPVAITFKVAVFSMSGDVYADSVATLAFSTAGYAQSNFSTFFGGEDTIEGLYAYDSLANKVENSNIRGWDASHGNNHFFYKKHTGKNDTVNTTSKDLEWGKISETYYNNTEKTLNDLSSKCPMLPVGTTTTTVANSINATLSDPIPLYLPTSFRITNNTQKNFYVFKDGSFNLNTLSIGAFDKDGAPYYGFKMSDGHWDIKNGESHIAYDKNTNTVKGISTGTAYLEWKLNDDVKYTADLQNGTVNKDNANSIQIAITVRDYPIN